MSTDTRPSAPELKVYNTLTRTREPFRPISPDNVRMYACGPTVYSFAHIGNARPIIVFDVLFRVLRQLFGPGRVTYVRNITDVDDKINKAAFERGITIRTLTGETAAQFHADIRELGVLMPDGVNAEGNGIRFIEPRATDHIDEMKQLIERLVAAGYAYVAEEHVLFHVPAMSDYGALSKRPLDEMEAGARVDVAPFKKSPLDFVLWKPSGPQDPAWPSPAGIAAPGRPGWHIECSAMSWKHLGETFDIHAGGIDLVFPHHENEIAQSRCCFGTPVMANYWLHNGFLQVEGQKMSKSLGNFKVIHDELEHWPGETLRLNMLRTHYRRPIDWTVKGLEESDKTLDRWYAAVADHCGGSDAAAAEFSGDVWQALLDDLNTPRAVAALHALENSGAYRELAANLRALGFLHESPEARLARRRPQRTVDEAAVNALIAERRKAREAKNWAESDRLRDELNALGVAVKDNKDGTTTWSVL
ncbi:MAG: cysteine--tRNA ligase [Methylobacteriaceae bacterium]|jgi:cysteinyl-tRNA synthetase|nr:cysteine--tRNA ligase [Methylobacteriaceae bacterium]